MSAREFNPFSELERIRASARHAGDRSALDQMVVAEYAAIDLYRGRALRQSRRSSMVEAAANVVAGYAAQLVILPAFGLHISFAQSVALCAVFTVVSLVRGYSIRRAFNWWQAR